MTAAPGEEQWIAGYLLDPASATYPISILGERYLGVDVVGDAGEDEAGQLFAEDPWRATAADAAAVALLAPVMEEEVDRLGLRRDGALDRARLGDAAANKKKSKQCGTCYRNDLVHVDLP